jgi:dolichol-phosphate mannosyltransferase
MPSTLFVIPTYNEALNVPRLAEPLDAVRKKLDFDLLFVDDNSPDGTAEEVEELRRTRPWIHLMHRPGRQGLGSAYRDGFRWGLSRGYDRVGEMDADLSHDPAALPDIAGSIDRGAALALGSRYVPGGSVDGWPVSRRALSRGANLFARGLLRLSIHDVTSGFRLYTAPAARHVIETGTLCDGYGFQVEATVSLVRGGFAVEEVPIHFTDRTLGSSKMSFAITREAARRCFALAFREPGGAAVASAPHTFAPTPELAADPSEEQR